MLKWLLVILAGLLVVLLVGFVWEAIEEWRGAPPPGEMVSVGGRRIHVRCTGSAAGPTIVLVMGVAEASPYWWPVQDRLAGFARVCSYDRPGMGWSDPVAGSQTMADRAAELRAVLAAAHVPGPYVLVGHSYGGPLARLFARDHPELVAGMVLVDAPDESAMFRQSYLDFVRTRMKPMVTVMGLAQRVGLLRLWSLIFPPDMPPDVRQALWATARPANLAAARDELESILRGPQLFGGSLGQRPLAVITHGKPFPAPFDVLDIGWAEGQRRLAALSGNSVLVVATNSSHMVHIDEPALVDDAIRRVWTAARDGSRL